MRLAFCTFAACFAASSLSHAAGFHDTFSTGTGVIQTDAAPFVEDHFTGATEAPGGGRYLANSINVGVAQPGQFTFAAVQSGAYFTLADAAIPLVTNLTYGLANGFGADLDLDLADQGAFVLDFRYVSAPMSLTLTVITQNAPGDNPNVAGYAQALDASLGEVLIVPFSAFIAATPGLVSWADIDAITLNISGPGGAGFALDSFGSAVTPVPEPSHAALLAAGLALVGWRVRRRGIARV